MRRSHFPLSFTLTGSFMAASAVSMATLGVFSGACDSPKPTGQTASVSASSAASQAVATIASSASVVDASASDASRSGDGGAHVMPERPVPRESPTVRANMSPEIQMKAITYMAAMRAPGPDDPPADEVYAEEVRKKLEGILRGSDHGPGKSVRGESIGGGRQIDLFMHTSICDDKTPARFVSQGGYTLAGLRARGIFVVKCNGTQVQCLQSTRDPGDILCTTAPRH